jgi:tRNA ligase
MWYAIRSSLLAHPLTPFSGKTAVAVALAHIFGFGHTQSDDVQAKKPAPVFIKNVTKLLEKQDVVIADKFISSSIIFLGPRLTFSL